MVGPIRVPVEVPDYCGRSLSLIDAPVDPVRTLIRPGGPVGIANVPVGPVGPVGVSIDLLDPIESPVDALVCRVGPC